MNTALDNGNLRHPRSTFDASSARPAAMKTRALRYERNALDAARVSFAEERTREVEELSRLSLSARRAQLKTDLRHAVAGEGSYLRRLHRDAARVSAARASARAAEWWTRTQSRSSRRESRAQHRKDVASSSADEGPPEEPPTKRRHEQTVILVASRNEKLGSGVWASIAPVHPTCATACPFIDNGCYAQLGPIGAHVKRLEANVRSAGMTAFDLAIEEATLVRRAAKRVPYGTPLRLHVAGDSASRGAAQEIGRAASEWPGPVWTYTRAWPHVERADWGTVSVLASIDTPTDALDAMARRYAPAIVVADFPNGARAWTELGVNFVPCPNETNGITCAECRLCFSSTGLLARGSGIAFRAHGSQRRLVEASLVQIRRRSEAVKRHSRMAADARGDAGHGGPS